MIVMLIPRRSAHPSARSANVCRQKAMATPTLVSVCTTMAIPMIVKRIRNYDQTRNAALARRPVPMRSMIVSSSTMTIAVAHPTTRPVLRHSGMRVKAQARVNT